MAHSQRLQVIGDTIELDGQTVALVVDDARRSGPVADFLDWLDGIDAITDDDPDAKTPDEVKDARAETEYEAALDDVQRVAKEYARGGLLRVADLARIVTSLKEG